MEERPIKLNLSDRPLLRLITLCILYVAQGIPYGFVTVTFASYLAEQGKSVEAIGAIIALGTLPWTFKFLWGVRSSTDGGIQQWDAEGRGSCLRNVG